MPEQSSLLIHHSTPSSERAGHAHRTHCVGNAAKGTRPAVGAFRPAAHEGGTYATRFMRVDGRLVDGVGATSPLSATEGDTSRQEHASEGR